MKFLYTDTQEIYIQVHKEKGMSDRIYVMSEGRITGELDAADATEEKIMAMATNAVAKGAAS